MNDQDESEHDWKADDQSNIDLDNGIEDLGSPELQVLRGV
jgi:hypothetical protein